MSDIALNEEQMSLAFALEFEDKENSLVSIDGRETFVLLHRSYGRRSVNTVSSEDHFLIMVDM